MYVVCSDDRADVTYPLTNISDRRWERAFSFICCKTGGTPIDDHEGTRTWVGVRGEPTPISQLPRQFGIRPTTQVYAVDGSPRPSELGFIGGLGITSAAEGLDG